MLMLLLHMIARAMRRPLLHSRLNRESLVTDKSHEKSLRKLLDRV